MKRNLRPSSPPGLITSNSASRAPRRARHEISGTKSHAQKLRVLEWVKQHRVALTLNFVIHRRNIDQLEEMVALAESSSATRVEFANVQYYGWAFANRENLLPTREQLDQSLTLIKREQERLQGRIRIRVRVPITTQNIPSPAWEAGAAADAHHASVTHFLPCSASDSGLSFENVNDRSLREIWRSPPHSRNSVAKIGCRNLARPATAESKTSAAAGARHCSSRETPLPPIPFAHSPRCVPKSTRFSSRESCSRFCKGGACQPRPVGARRQRAAHSAFLLYRPNPA